MCRSVAGVLLVLMWVMLVPLGVAVAQSSCDTFAGSQAALDVEGNYKGWTLRVDAADDVDVYSVRAGTMTGLGSLTVNDVLIVPVETTQLRLIGPYAYTLTICPAGVAPTATATTPTPAPATTPTATPSVPAPIGGMENAPVLPVMNAIGDGLLSLVSTPLGMFLAALVLLVCIFEGLWMFLVSRRS